MHGKERKAAQMLLLLLLLLLWSCMDPLRLFRALTAIANLPLYNSFHVETGILFTITSRLSTNMMTSWLLLLWLLFSVVVVEMDTSSEELSTTKCAKHRFEGNGENLFVYQYNVRE